MVSADFYPRSPCGERLAVFGAPNVSKYISIHALLAESDLRLRMRKYTLTTFLSTLSLRRATASAVAKNKIKFISIHALLAESDPGNAKPVRIRRDFYPRSPCGERR